MSKVFLTEEATNFIVAQGEHAVSVTLEGVGGCSLPLFIPRVTLGVPADTNAYLRYQVGEVHVFIERNALLHPEGAKIDLIGKGERAYLEARGIYHPVDDSGLCKFTKQKTVTG